MVLTAEQLHPADPASEELVRLYQAAQSKLRDWVLHPPGGTENAVAYRRARAAELCGQTQKLLADLGVRTDRWIGKTVPSAWKEGKALADKQAREAGVALAKGEGGLSGGFSVIDRRSAEVFARAISQDMAKARGAMGEQTQRLLRATAAVKINLGTGEEIGRAQAAERGLSESDISRLLAGGVILGMPAQTARELREQLRLVYGDKIGIRDRNGGLIHFEVGYYARLVAVTQTREATTKARHERLVDEEIDLVAIIGRRSVNFCTAFLGQVFSLSGKSTKYPAYSSLPDGGPPFHPQCSKSTRPFIEDLATPEQLDRAETTPQSASLLGLGMSQAQKAYVASGGAEEARARIQERTAPSEEVRFQRFDSGESAETWGQDNSKAWAESLSQAEREALHVYQRDNYFTMNVMLAGLKGFPHGDVAFTPSEQSQMRPKIAALKAALERSRVKQNVVVHRAVRAADYGFSSNNIDQRLVGTVLSPRTFQSTSLLRDRADSFMGLKDDPVLLEIRVKAGAKGAFLNAVNPGDSYAREKELLLPPGTQMKILDVAETHSETLHRNVKLLIVEVSP